MIIFMKKITIMTSLDNIKNSLIDQILLTKNEKLLKAIANIFDSTEKEDSVQLSSEQIEMLLMSENDIKEGNVISEEELMKSDLEWLK